MKRAWFSSGNSRERSCTVTHPECSAPQLGKMQRLALTPSGNFVRASDLEPVKPSEFKGVELDDKTELPVAFVVNVA